ncbi:cupin domain-containing protein [Caldalkalibacillus salinus]|uniref:cupin domain-containing protein n=1 Tax=Caldalkalibacillus salinus TaxID=2803787 RepID=UPI001924C012|nr:cupin domain-containing protein [Caldalkalibacillus salinus]
MGFLTNDPDIVESMSLMPRTVGNELSGEKVTFTKTTKDTACQSLEFVTILDPEDGIFPHRHTYLTEVFEILEGELTLRLNRETLHLKAGDQQSSVVVPPYVTHSFWNHTDQVTRFKVTMSPAGDFEPFIRIGYGLENDQLTFNYKRFPVRGKYPLFRRALRALESILGVVPKSPLMVGILGKLGGTYAPVIPIVLQKMMIHLLAAVAVRLGKDRDVEKYFLKNGTKEGVELGATYGTQPNPQQHTADRSVEVDDR